MEYKWFKYNNIQQAEAMKLRLDNRVSHLFDDVTKEYTEVLMLNDGSASVVVMVNGLFWDEIYEELNPNDINNLEPIDKSLIINSEV